MLGLCGLPAAAAPALPAKAWRGLPPQVTASTEASALQPLISGGDANWYPQVVSTSDSPSFAFAAGNAVQTLMLTYGGSQTRADVAFELAEAAVTGTSGLASASWTVLEVQRPTHFLDQFTFTSTPGHWYRLRVLVDVGTPRPTTVYMNDVALYDLSGTQPKDYWLMLGASIEVQSIDNRDFKNLIKRFYGYDPVMFNLSKGGWMTTQLKAALPGFLALHPHARYVAIHIGGNNVSYYHPYPNGADMLGNDLAEILDSIVAAGKIPVLARLTYRAYSDRSPVPPESNGSLPYDVNVVDPLIHHYSPDFYDSSRQQGVIDGYSWFEKHPEQLLDGIHLTAAGSASWRDLWAEQAGAVVYQMAPNCGTSCLVPYANLPAGTAAVTGPPMPASGGISPPVSGGSKGQGVPVSGSSGQGVQASGVSDHGAPNGAHRGGCQSVGVPSLPLLLAALARLRRSKRR